MKYGYARLSPNEDEKKHAHQMELLEKASVDELVVEELPGKSRRKELLECLVGNIYEVDNWWLNYAAPERVEGKLKPGDWLAIMDLSRIGNNIGAARKIVDEVLNAGAAVHLLESGLKIKSTGEAAYKMLKAASDAEWRLRGERTAQGIKSGKKRGRRYGRPEILSKAQEKEVFKLIDKGMTQSDVKRFMRQKYPELDKEVRGFSQPTISRLLGKRKQQA